MKSLTEEELETVGDSGETSGKSGAAAAVGKVFSTLTTLVIVALLGFLIYATVAAARGKIVSVFGRCLLTVVTGSMEPTLHVGDFILVEKTDPAALREGDIIAFWSEQQDIYGMLVTHRIVGVTETGFVTRGDANPVDDSVEVVPGRILGRYTGKARLFRWASSFGDFRKLILLIVMIATTVAAFYEVRTIGRLKHTIDEEKQSKEDEREQLIREAIEREKARLAAEGFGADVTANPAEPEISDKETSHEEPEVPAKEENSDKKTSHEEPEAPAEEDISDKETSPEEPEAPAEEENSDKKTSPEEPEAPAKEEISDKETSPEEPEAPAEEKISDKETSPEKPEAPSGQTVEKAPGGAGKSPGTGKKPGGKPSGSKPKPKSKKKKKRKKH